MKDSYQVVIDGLKARFRYMISKYEMLKEEKIELENLNKQYIQKINNSNIKIKELEQKIDNLQLIEAFKASVVDVNEAKHNIRKMVREIDKCITLLND